MSEETKKAVVEAMDEHVTGEIDEDPVEESVQHPADRKGIHTTEFWLTLVTLMLGAFVASGLLPTEHVAMKISGMLTMVLSGLGYGIARAVTKRAAP